MQVEREMQQVQEVKRLEIEARSFFMYIEEEIRRSDQFETPTSYVLRFRDDAGGTIMYWMTGNRLCRQVNGTGYVVILQYVSRVDFTVFPNGCQVYIELTKGGVSWKGEVFIAKRVELAA
ncbi:competence type IV pilus minor pilin ComGF [Aneurinibacillus uraniidurans]|uniref:competence type IV pilus minor pilin ComGF n=1 Tax=Aneurinibacillus uraniidurans TaxID=2966586 RepID=UPI0023490423|nr:competence type IV pilus minor pilin ComGF [Aneurinibacillus sp. B1]WCN38878.1 competence type IV pilus minor pilin ComGF [Aneurinibacillus sp. B1]